MSAQPKEIILRCREDGTWEEYKEPYATIKCETEEDFRHLKEAVEHYGNLVHCEKCVHYRETQDWNSAPYMACHKHADVIILRKNPEDYCSEGERKPEV